MLLRRINDRKLPPCKAFYAEQTTDSSIAIFKLLCKTLQTVEVWHSLVAYFVRDEEGRRFKSSHLDQVFSIIIL